MLNIEHSSSAGRICLVQNRCRSSSCSVQWDGLDMHTLTHTYTRIHTYIQTNTYMNVNNYHRKTFQFVYVIFSTIMTDVRHFIRIETTWMQSQATHCLREWAATWLGYLDAHLYRRTRKWTAPANTESLLLIFKIAVVDNTIQDDETPTQ